MAKSLGVGGTGSFGAGSLTLSVAGAAALSFFTSSGVHSRDRFRGPSPFSMPSSGSPRASSNERFRPLPCSEADAVVLESPVGVLLLEGSMDVSFSCWRTGRSSLSEAGERASPLVTAEEAFGQILDFENESVDANMITGNQRE